MYVSFSATNTSMVRASRTVRALSRAFLSEKKIEWGWPGSIDSAYSAACTSARTRAGRLAAVAVGEDRAQLAPLRPGDVLVEAQDLAAHLLGDDQEPRDVLRPLEIAPHPVERVGDPGEDHGSRGASTQVSLLPPPWEELTTNEPGRSATRVRPPGKTRMRSP